MSAGTIVAAAAMGGLASLTACSQGEAPQPKLVSVNAVPVGSATFEDSIKTIGTLEALEEVSLATRVAGRIESLLVKEGDQVKAGQLLLELDQTQQQAKLASAKEGRDNICLDYKRYEWLAQQGAVREIQRDSFRASCLQENEKVKAAEADLLFSNVKAPIDGIVSDLTVKLGDVVKAETPFTKVVRNDRLEMRIEIPAVHSARVRVGLPVMVSQPNEGDPPIRTTINFVDPNVTSTNQGLLVKAEVPNPNGQWRTGLRLGTSVVLDSQSLPAVPFAAVTQTSGQSFVFQLGSLEDLEKSPGKAPIDSLRQLPPQTRFALQTPVKLGTLQQNNYSVLKGLAEGSNVITTNLLNLRHGTPVELKKN
jgi:RND family efflux transporter MFP subunit